MNTMKTWLLALVASLAALSGSTAAAPPAGPDDPVTMAAAEDCYMVYYKMPSWRSWKSCGPYSYQKARKVATDLKDQGYRVCIEKAD